MFSATGRLIVTRSQQEAQRAGPAPPPLGPRQWVVLAPDLAHTNRLFKARLEDFLKLALPILQGHRFEDSGTRILTVALSGILGNVT